MKRESAVLAFCLAASQTAEAFYCGNFLIQEGDNKEQVLEKCGQPGSYQSRVEYRSTVVSGPVLDGVGIIIYQPHLGFVRQEQINVDEWTYNFGRQRFIQFLHFENGRLIYINDSGYGMD